MTGNVPLVSYLDIAHFKEAVGHYVTGVVVVTAATDNGPAGFTCQSFGSLSLEPMLVCFAAKSAGQSWSRVKQADAVAISILSADQEALARVFATSGIDKFEGVGWTEGPRGTPLLEGAIAHLEGQMISRATHGDHDIVVVSIDFVASHPGPPLAYYRGGFGGFA